MRYWTNSWDNRSLPALPASRARLWRCCGCTLLSSIWISDAKRFLLACFIGMWSLYTNFVSSPTDMPDSNGAAAGSKPSSDLISCQWQYSTNPPLDHGDQPTWLIKCLSDYLIEYLIKVLIFLKALGSLGLREQFNSQNQAHWETCKPGNQVTRWKMNIPTVAVGYPCNHVTQCLS